MLTSSNLLIISETLSNNIVCYCIVCLVAEAVHRNHRSARNAACDRSRQELNAW